MNRNRRTGRQARRRRTKRQRNIIVTTAVFLAVLIVISIILGQTCSGKRNTQTEVMATAPSTDADTSSEDSYMIQNVHVIEQKELKAGCETYACTMLLQILGFKVDEFTIADNYLDCHYVYTDEDGTKYGPDMHSGFAGTAYGGWGVYAPAMAKSMNRYLSDQKSKLKAYDQKDIPLETLCEEYVSKGVPVMVWATTDMDEPYVFDKWIVNYVDENAEAKMGDEVPWYMHEHCLVLIGYDKTNYIFADSTHGKISTFEKSLVAKRYEQMGKQTIVVK
ncbi:MAG: C39 family peptidase [Ruminococcus sp.]|nr:C39 family peptidase [uncultured Ruminococcus sp.]MBQ1350313.1 C39 family peptidase [Ruminococcus sp.]MBQ4170725.1 C39 family peptidase [Ruminococcus sp.]SCX20040.1 Uncharacterized protein YvpB [Ruminococcaceae bacterium P7]